MLLFDIKDHVIQINFVDGFECLDNTGKIIKIIKTNNYQNNLQFTIQNNQELSIFSPNENIDNLIINQSNIRIVANNDKVYDNSKYIADKTLEIAKLSNINQFNRVGIRAKFTLNQDISKELKSKSFKSDKIKFFSLVFDELRLNDKISCSIKLFTGSENNFNTASAFGGFLLKMENKPLETMYVFDVDIFIAGLKGIQIEDLHKEIDNLLKETIQSPDTFLEKIKQHIF